MATRILLIRHGTTAVMDRMLAGRTPHLPLSEEGREQAAKLGVSLKPIGRVVSSPIERAMQTAEILAAHGHPAPEAMALFTEFDFGDWSGREFSELQATAPWRAFNESRATERAPNGESMHDVQQRAVFGIRQLIHQEVEHEVEHQEVGRTVAVISHADVIRAVVLHFTGSPMNNFWRFEIHAASITELVCGPAGDERLARLNDCSHLRA